MEGIREETDMLGSRDVEQGVLYGIHSLRARENFVIAARPVRPELIHAYGAVKLAALKTNHELNPWPRDVYESIQAACVEMSEGGLDEHIIVDALQGGAGTSTNMNVNEVLANRALQILGEPLGSYDIIDPLDDINLHQSTNDSYPSALKVAAIIAVRQLAERVTELQDAFQRQEQRLNDVVKVARTQMQDAVLTTLGREMSAYAESLSRDRWRIFKCEERLRVINLGGTAIGTGIGAPRNYIFRVVDALREIVGFGLTRGENLVDVTQNADVFVEVSGILKTLAVNLQKIAGDLRFMSSGPEAGIGEISLPPLQAGSSIMPSKVNPVIPEAVIQAALKVIANDQALTTAAAMGNLELNAFMPLIADTLLENIALLSQACTIFAEKCVEGLSPEPVRCAALVNSSTAALTALVDEFGYNRIKEVAARAEAEGLTIEEAVVANGLCSREEFQDRIAPEQVMQLGSRKK